MSVPEASARPQDAESPLVDFLRRENLKFIESTVDIFTTSDLSRDVQNLAARLQQSPNRHAGEIAILKAATEDLRRIFEEGHIHLELEPRDQ